MIKVTLTNEILRYITEIEQNRYKVSSVKLSKTVMNKLRKNSKKKSSYASNKIIVICVFTGQACQVGGDTSGNRRGSNRSRSACWGGLFGAGGKQKETEC